MSPGPVSTDLWLGEHGVAETVAKAMGVDAATARENVIGGIDGFATDRFTTPEEVATLVVFLASGLLVGRVLDQLRGCVGLREVECDAGHTIETIEALDVAGPRHDVCTLVGERARHRETDALAGTGDHVRRGSRRDRDPDPRPFVANGADPETVHSVVTTALAQSSGFFTLMQQFVGAGLIVGVAGIGVIMFRAVRERRREVGVLRSLGFPSSAVARTFMFEAGFVATLGVVIGVVIALIASYVLAVAGADFAVGFQFGVPVGEVLLIMAVALVPAMLAAVLPPRQASRIEPAVALRAND